MLLSTIKSTVLLNNYKQEAHGPHRSPEQQFLVTLHFVAYAFSILNIEPLSGDPVMVRGLWLA